MGDEIVIREYDEQNDVNGIKVVDKLDSVEIVSFSKEREILIDLTAGEVMELYLVLREILKSWL